MRKEALSKSSGWVTPRLDYRGTVGEILLQGGGKQSTSPSDSGEIYCPKPKCPDSGPS